MSNALAVMTNKLAQRLDMGVDGSSLIDTLKATAFKGQVTDAQMVALLVVANQYGLNPWTKELYAFPDKNNGIIPVVGVDGWSRIINSNENFDGMDFEQDDEKCTCIIHRKDRAHPIKVTEYMSECRRDVQPWKSHPRRMLRHKAMIQCARIAFGYVGIFDPDEAERIADGDTTPAEKDISADLKAINDAQSMEALQAAFTKAWTANPDKGARERLTTAKDARKQFLAANPPIEGVANAA
jgi:phage recombination protein Bet